MALAELEALGLTVADLLAVADQTPTARPVGSTVAAYLPSVAESYPPRTRRTYNSYWRLAVELIGDASLEEVTSDDVLAIADEAARRAGVRRPGSDGRASRESTIAAVRAIFTRAHRAGLVPSNPALLVDKPRRLESRRRALAQTELDELWAAVAATTNHPPNPGQLQSSPFRSWDFSHVAFVLLDSALTSSGRRLCCPLRCALGARPSPAGSTTSTDGACT